MAGEEDDGQRRVRFSELPLQVQPAEPGQTDVEHQTARRIGAKTGEEGSRVGEQLHLQSYRRDEPTQRVPDRRIVIDDEHDGLRRAHGLGGGKPRLSTTCCPGVAMV